MSDLEKAARMALEAICGSGDFLFNWHDCEPNNEREMQAYQAALAANKKAFNALRQALEQPEYASDADTEELTHLNSLPEPLRLAAMLEKTMQWPLHGKAADCLRKMHAALSEQSAQQQEPVAWYGVNIAGVKYLGWKYEELDDRGFDVFPLYKSPQRKPWVGLTEKEKREARNSVSYSPLAMTISEWTEAVQDATEAKLKEKNA